MWVHDHVGRHPLGVERQVRRVGDEAHDTFLPMTGGEFIAWVRDADIAHNDLDAYFERIGPVRTDAHMVHDGGDRAPVDNGRRLVRHHRRGRRRRGGGPRHGGRGHGHHLVDEHIAGVDASPFGHDAVGA